MTQIYILAVQRYTNNPWQSPFKLLSCLIFTLVVGRSWSVLLPLLNCLSSFEEDWESSDTRADSLEPCKLVCSAACDVPCCRAELWGPWSSLRGDTWGGTISPWEPDSMPLPWSTSICSPLESYRHKMKCKPGDVESGSSQVPFNTDIHWAYVMMPTNLHTEGYKSHNHFQGYCRWEHLL